MVDANTHTPGGLLVSEIARALKEAIEDKTFTDYKNLSVEFYEVTKEQFPGQDICLTSLTAEHRSGLDIIEMTVDYESKSKHVISVVLKNNRVLHCGIQPELMTTELLEQLKEK